MLCPRTQSELKKINVGKVPVYVSQQCGGVFFENQTLQHFEQFDSQRGKVLVEHLKQFHTELLDEDHRVNCPSCPDVVMMRRYYSPKRVVEIDECPNCAGIWLDTGELAQLQPLMLNRSEKAKLRQKIIDSSMPPQNEGVKQTPTRETQTESNVDKVFNITELLFGGFFN